ncbi:iron-sulfur cluster insertion protein ErpA [Candidatus Pantoea edessiphila]|uniref:Iron-sulfur cluster insertion protein ErpA n=1 Tax=Candidatus Pantoea edessiphila TaxID=2044610 RepID=A0A2P5SY01_9GAMM|nr:iron-sulfur cluster insertion protein ErpA [Candidatus Pantoea edessiphila]MBK4775574.1 iron-sulfur cluster insertion protein ErpA [Pantoea sp. Edef]PPI87227.1 iron-sulfur cluster insertion protein ErpA [Candidatus Pantoea edessiphila]
MDIKSLIPLKFTDAAVNKIKLLIKDKGNNHLKLRVYISGGGCSGFQYGFTLDDIGNAEDIIFTNQGISLIIDPISIQYLNGSLIDYKENLEGSRFVVINPNAKITCSCGSSFGI